MHARKRPTNVTPWEFLNERPSLYIRGPPQQQPDKMPIMFREGVSGANDDFPNAA